MDTDARNFGLGRVLSQIQDNVERVIGYCSRALRPSQRKYCTTKREMRAAVSMCIQFRSYLRGAKFTLRTDHKSSVATSIQGHRGHDGLVGYTLCNNSSFLSCIGQVETIATLTDFQEPQLLHVDSVLALIAPPWTRLWRCRINHLTPSH